MSRQTAAGALKKMLMFMGQKKQIRMVKNGLSVLAPAKINLSLLIAGRRPDGYHNIETVMAKVAWYDRIVIERGRKKGIELVCRGPHWSPQGEENLIYRACKLLLDESRHQADVKITLWKNIPAGSGLGSASSDAAATLIGVKKLLGLRVKKGKLDKIAAILGSDVPFFLGGHIAYCTGKGERVQKIKKKNDFLALVVLPEVNISTKMVYNNYRHDEALYRRLHRQVTSSLKKDRIDLVAQMCANMLQTSCFRINEKLGQLKNRLETLTATKWCLTGSGSGMFSIIGQNQKRKAGKCQREVEEKTGCNCIIVRNNKW
jgi:4-diphosphocytidyl-2-C-methyl-D-erythritol kinase